MPSPVPPQFKGGFESMQRPSAAITLLFLMTVTACSPDSKQPAPAPGSADGRLRDIYTKEWRWREEQFAADEDSHRPISDHLPKVDPASQEARLRYWEDVLKQLEALQRTGLSPAEQ